MDKEVEKRVTITLMFVIFVVIGLALAWGLGLARAEAATIEAKQKEAPPQQEFTYQSVEKLQDLGSLHALWSLNLGTQVCLVIAPNNPGPVAMNCFLGIRGVDVSQPINIGEYHNLWTLEADLEWQPNQYCKVILATDPMVPPIFDCSLIG